MDNSNIEKQCSFCVFLILLRLYDVLETTWCPSKHDLKYNIYIDSCYLKIKVNSLVNSKHQLLQKLSYYIYKKYFFNHKIQPETLAEKIGKNNL